MSDSNSVSKDSSKTDHESTESTYYPGTVWEGSMFATGARDPRVWGPQNPLEFVPPAGPFDDEDSEESWRVSNGGRDIFTGEVHIRSRAPSAQQQERRNQFWQQHDARASQEASGRDEQHPVYEPARSPRRFPDALPVSTAPLTSQHMTSRPPTAPTLAQSRSRLPYSPAPAPSAQTSSDVDGEYELDDEHLPEAPQGQALPAATKEKEQPPDSTPPKTSSPHGTDDWDDDNLLSFWKFKVIRKKGYEPMLAHFPDQTIESLHETWKTHRKRCEELGAAWRAAGKPEGPVVEWFDE